ncbi:MAG: site-specific DNA-methyltransferase [Thermomonas sp.]
MPKSLPDPLPESVRSEIPGASPDFRTELAARLAELVPEAVADGKIDAKKLAELLGDDAVDESERFGLFWPGKKRALRAAQAPTTATLKPDFANSKDWDTTRNVFIEGDNLEVLKILQRHYHNKVKLIYIDPPYNTGKDFVYPDNFTEGLETYLEWTRQVNEKGKKVSTNSETEGRYHSNWLNMMYPRLKLARNLLTDDGVIFISIDDHEVANLRRLCDEVFGENHFEGMIHWRRRHNQPNDPTKLIGLVAEHILVYARNSASLKAAGVGKLPLTGKFSNPDNDPRGAWNSKPWKVGSGQSGSRYTITTPNGSVLDEEWMGEETTFDNLKADGRIHFPNGGDGMPRKKIFESERLKEGQSATNWFTHDQFGSNQQGSDELTELFNGRKKIFDNPKPTQLLKSIIQLGNAKDGDIVLDFFAGASSTAHSVMALNAEDNDNRRFIMVQLPEPTPEESEARKAGFATIADISRKRIELAGEKIGKGDTGFRAYKLTDTHFTKWRVTNEITPTQLEQHLLDLRDSADDEASRDDLLTELLLKLGLSLTETIATKTIAGLDVREVGDNRVLACVNEHVKPTLEQLRALVDVAPGKLIVLEDAFHGDDQLKTNLAQYAKNKGIELRTA